MRNVVIGALGRKVGNDGPGMRADRRGQRLGAGFLRQRRHCPQACAHGCQVLAHELQHLFVAEYLVLARGTLECANLFGEQPIVLGGFHARENQGLALFGQAIQVDQGPDDGDE